MRAAPWSPSEDPGTSKEDRQPVRRLCNAYEIVLNSIYQPPECHCEGPQNSKRAPTLTAHVRAGPNRFQNALNVPDTPLPFPSRRGSTLSAAHLRALVSRRQELPEQLDALADLVVVRGAREQVGELVLQARRRGDTGRLPVVPDARRLERITDPITPSQTLWDIT